MLQNSHFKNILEICKEISNNNVYMIIGFGEYHQFKDEKIIKKVIKNILSNILLNSYLLYFGDDVRKENLDIGLIFNMISKLRPDLKIIMIQIDEYRKKILPRFVYKTYYHSDYVKEGKNKYGGLTKMGNPVSNTKKWILIHKNLKDKYNTGITNVFFLGGGGLTKKEMELCFDNKIPFIYFPLIRKYKGDKKSIITSKDNINDKFGPTLELLSNIKKNKLSTIINYYPKLINTF